MDEKTPKTPEELLAFAKENNIELSEEDLDAVSGGMNSGSVQELINKLKEHGLKEKKL